MSEKYYLSETILKTFEKYNKRRKKDEMRISPSLCKNSWRLNESTPITRDIKRVRIGKWPLDSVYSSDGISPTLCGSKGGYLGSHLRILNKKKVNNVFKTQLKTKNGIATTLPRWYGFQVTNTFIVERISKLPLSEQAGLIRRLTPIECERLQSFPDGWTEGISDTRRYSCLGNAVTTNVITKIGQKLWTSLQRKKEVK